MRSVNALVRSLKNRYGNKIDVSIIDPSSILSLWHHIRYKLNPSLPAWVLDRKKIFDGVPELSDLEHAIDEKLASLA